MVPSLLAYGGAQAVNGLRVELRYARLAHAEHLPDLLEGAVLLVIQGEDLDELRGQRLDGRGHRLAELALVDRVVGRRDLGPSVEVVEVEQLEARHAGGGDLLERRAVHGELHAEDLRNFLFFGLPPELARQLADRPGDAARSATHVPRRGVEAPQVVEHGAPDSVERVRLELLVG